MRELINSKLNRIAFEKDVIILYAAESGSRAWGFASDDSDYDVRFIYRRDKADYLRLTDYRDVIEHSEGDLDIVGWDLKKALNLGVKSNPQLTEWLHSPIVYRNLNGFGLRLLNLMSDKPNLVAMYHAYRSLCKSTFKAELKGEELRIKKFFYCLRPIAACHYIEVANEIPPTAMEWLLTANPFPPSILTGYRELVRLKSETEASTVLKSEWLEVYEYIENFLTEEVSYDTIIEVPNKEAFNSFFLRELNYGMEL